MSIPNQRIVLYVVPDKPPADHAALMMCDSHKNPRGKYVVGKQFSLYGLYYPSSVAATKEELAKAIGLEILDKIGIK
jgi:hypothetical protein